MKVYKFRTVLLSIIRSLFPVHSAMVYVIHVCRELSSSLQTYTTYPIVERTVNKLLIMDRRTVRNM